MKTPILKIQHLTKRFGGITAVNQATFGIEENSITSLIGPNGAGKTTLFDLVTGFIKQDRGTITFRGRNMEQMAAHERARLGLARTFQAIRVFPELTAVDNILLGLPEYDDRLRAAMFGAAEKARSLQSKALKILESVNLYEKASTRAGDLSYGQQKLLEIGRAVATEAELYLFDEPAAGVNRTLLHQISAIIKRLQKEGKTIVIVEHDMGFVMELSHRVIVMDYGKEIAEGTPEEIQKNPKVLEAYLGIKHEALGVRSLKPVA